MKINKKIHNFKTRVVYIDGSGIATLDEIHGNIYGGAGFGSTAVTGNRVQFGVVNNLHVSVYGLANMPSNAGSGSVFGGRGENGDVSNNSVLFADTYDGWIEGAVYGGFATGNGNVSGNEVTSERGSSFEASGTIVGGMATNGAVRDNMVRMHGGIADRGLSGDGAVWGGLALGSGAATGNKVFLDYDSVVVGDVFGGSSAAGEVNGNSVFVGGSTELWNNAGVYGGYNAGPAANTAAVTNNAVTIAIGGTVNGRVVGGMSKSDGDVSANAVAFESGTATREIYGGYATNGNATQNEVVLSGGQAQNCIYGGWSDNGSASGNSVVLGGGSVDGDVYGGHGATSATGNAVTVRNGVAFIGGSSLRGGNHSDFSGNVLNTSGHGYSLDAVENFETYNFSLSREDAGETVYALAQAVDTTGTSVNVVFDNQGAPMEVGEEITLFSQTTGSMASLAGTTAASGALFDHDIVLYEGPGNRLLLGVTGTRASRETRLFGMTQLAGLHMVNLAGDLQRGIADLVAASEYCRATGQNEDGAAALACNRPAVFAGFMGGSSKWDTGGDSKLSVDHASLITGVGHRFGDVLLAGYFEAGWGQYDGKLRGRLYNNNDETRYYGGGVLARYHFDGFYAEGSFHAGSATSEFAGDVRATQVNYDCQAAYYGLGAVFGYRGEITGSRLDLSLAYSWNRLGGDTIRVGPNSVILDSITSHRLRAGGRWTAASTEAFAPYAGVAGECELDGKSSGRVRDYALAGARANGFTGIGEAGLHFGSGESRYSADVGIEGYLGKRTGVSVKALFAMIF